MRFDSATERDRFNKVAVVYPIGKTMFNLSGKVQFYLLNNFKLYWLCNNLTYFIDFQAFLPNDSKTLN